MAPDALAVAGFDRGIGEERRADETPRIRFSAGSKFRLQLIFRDIQTIQVVVVFVVEPAEHDHAASDEAGRGLPPRRGQTLVADFECLDCFLFGVKDHHVIQIAAEPASENVDLPLENRRGVPPPQDGRVFPFLPAQVLDAVVLDQGSQVDRVDVADAAILGMAARDDEELVLDYARRMKPPATRPSGSFGDGHFPPFARLQVEDPKVVQVGDGFASEHHEVGVDQLSRVVGPLPGSLLAV